MLVRFVPTAASARASKETQSAAAVPAAPAPLTNAAAAGGVELPKGTLDVRASGLRVHVECEGRDLGVTPLRVELAPGFHRFRIVPGNGDAVASADVVIEPGEHYLMEVERGAAAPPSQP